MELISILSWVNSYLHVEIVTFCNWDLQISSDGCWLLIWWLVKKSSCFSAAWIDKCRPDLLITESTYATTIRDSKRCRERDFLKKVHETVERGGKVQHSDLSDVVFALCEALVQHWYCCSALCVLLRFHRLNHVSVAGSYPSFCPWSCPGTLHFIGNVLVSAASLVHVPPPCPLHIEVLEVSMILFYLFGTNTLLSFPLHVGPWCRVRSASFHVSLTYQCFWL